MIQSMSVSYHAYVYVGTPTRIKIFLSLRRPRFLFPCNFGKPLEQFISVHYECSYGNLLPPLLYSIPLAG